MTTIDGDRVSKYSIKAIRISKKVSAQMCEEFKKLAHKCVLPTKE
jgi:hypothetical protein